MRDPVLFLCVLLAGFALGVSLAGIIAIGTPGFYVTSILSFVSICYLALIAKQRAKLAIISHLLPKSPDSADRSEIPS